MTSVFKRAPKWSYGIQGYVRFDSHSSEHRERTTFTTSDGYEKVNGVWCEIVKKVAMNVSYPIVRVLSTYDPQGRSIRCRSCVPPVVLQDLLNPQS
jgi:hypothetical protein